jgi:hypothetical protein
VRVTVEKRDGELLIEPYTEKKEVALISSLKLALRGERGGTQHHGVLRACGPALRT